MESPVHDTPRYRCPSDSFFVQLGVSVPSETSQHERVFKTLAGLVSHLDGGKCRDENGGKKVVQELVARIAGDKLLGK